MVLKSHVRFMLSTLLLLPSMAGGLRSTIGGYAVRPRYAKTKTPGLGCNDDDEDMSLLFTYCRDLGANTGELNLKTPVHSDVLAAQIWPAARLLAYDILDTLLEIEPLVLPLSPAAASAVSSCAQEPPILRLCELGAGSGLVGLSAARASQYLQHQRCQQPKQHDGSPQMRAAWEVLLTDVDPLAPMLSEAAAHDMGLDPSLVRTARADLLRSAADGAPLPGAHLYVLADVFVDDEVARGAARRCAEALASGALVLVAAQADRSCRETFLAHLRSIAQDAEATSAPCRSQEVRAKSSRAASSYEAAGMVGRGAYQNEATRIGCADLKRSTSIAEALSAGWIRNSRKWRWPLCLVDVDESAVPYC